MLPKEVASRDTSWGYRLHCLIEPASGSPLEDRLCAGKPCRPPELLEAAVAASTRSWERLRREELPEFHLCVHVWPQEQGLVPLFCTKLLHLPYYVHLELKKLQSRLLNWLSRAFSKGGRQWGGRKVGVGAEGIQRKRPKETSWPFPRFRGVRLRCAVRLVYLEPRCWRILKSFLGLGHLGSSHLWTYLDLQFISRLTKAWPGTADCPACSEPCPAARKGSSPPPWCPTRSQRQAGRGERSQCVPWSLHPSVVSGVSPPRGSVSVPRHACRCVNVQAPAPCGPGQLFAVHSGWLRITHEFSFVQI